MSFEQTTPGLLAFVNSHGSGKEADWVGVALGKVVDLVVTFDGNYAVWGQTPDGDIGVVHCFEWSAERPVPEQSCPKVGDQLRVKVMRVVGRPQETLPADATFGGKIRIDFVGSIRLVGSSVVWPAVE